MSRKRIRGRVRFACDVAEIIRPYLEDPEAEGALQKLDTDLRKLSLERWER